MRESALEDGLPPQNIPVMSMKTRLHQSKYDHVCSMASSLDHKFLGFLGSNLDLYFFVTTIHNHKKSYNLPRQTHVDYHPAR